MKKLNFLAFVIGMLALEYGKKRVGCTTKGQIDYTYIFEKNQEILKNAVIILLLLLYDELIE
ncbi:hypothetical protein [Chryseobacterium ginsengisoli]